VAVSTDRGTVDMTSVATLSLRARGLFQDLISEIESRNDGEPVSAEAVTDALERFTLWAGNLGAMKVPAAKLSLDSRLASAPEIKDQICQQLQELAEALEELIGITNGLNPNRRIKEDDIEASDSGSEAEDEDEDEDDNESDLSASDTCGPADEAHIILEVISECLKFLFKIGILIRKSGNPDRDRFKRALQVSEAFPHTWDVTYVRERHPKLGPSSLNWLSTRLGSTVSKRRQFIKYCRDHKTRLAEGATAPGPTNTAPLAEGMSAKALTEKLSSKATEQVSSKATTFFQPAQQQLLMAAADDEEEDDDAVSLLSASTTTESLAALRLPRLTDLSPEQQPFECPICFTLQAFKHEKSWRAHAFRDLKAYVCTVGNECESELFGDRASWFEHEVKHHRARYTCTLCEAVSSATRRELETHILSVHGSFPKDQLGMLEDAGRKYPVEYKASECPFCDDWSTSLRAKADAKEKWVVATIRDGDVLVSADRFRRHVAVHQEQLAIFAVPRGTDHNASVGSASGSVAGSMSTRSSFSSSQDENYNDMPTDQDHDPSSVRQLGAEQRYKCNWSGCNKSYSMLNLLNAHIIMRAHGTKRTPGEFPHAASLAETETEAPSGVPGEGNQAAAGISEDRLDDFIYLEKALRISNQEHAVEELRSEFRVRVSV
jgi:hypothetical protein